MRRETDGQTDRCWKKKKEATIALTVSRQDWTEHAQILHLTPLSQFWFSRRWYPCNNKRNPPHFLFHSQLKNISFLLCLWPQTEYLIKSEYHVYRNIHNKSFFSHSGHPSTLVLDWLPEQIIRFLTPSVLRPKPHLHNSAAPGFIVQLLRESFQLYFQKDRFADYFYR